MISLIRKLSCALVILTSVAQADVPHLISFQGVLEMGGTELTGSYEITFRIFDAAAGGAQVWSETDSVTATNGYYAVVLGHTAPLNINFNQDLWLALQITGQPEMAPRYELTASPFALAIADNAADSAKIKDGSVLLLDLAQSGADSGQVPKWNGTAWVAGNDETNAPATPPWQRTGQDVTLTDTTDRVGIGTATPAEKLDVYGNLLVSGRANIGSGNSNSGLSAFVTGLNNGATGNYSTVGGGQHNIASASGATVSGGTFDSATGMLATVGGGTANTASGAGATIGGGQNNTAQDLYPTIAGGHSNAATADYATVSGGQLNAAGAIFSWVGGGSRDSATGDYASVAGGSDNLADGNYAAIGGGALNRSSGNRSTVGGGSTNTAAGLDATVGGGLLNLASDQSGTVAGGGHNAAVGNYASVGGGFADSARGLAATIAGGYRNFADAPYALVGGGSNNRADSNYASIGGGLNNTAIGYAASVGGGSFDTASGDFSTVAGGRDNKASGDYSVALGRASTAEGDNTLAAGLQAKALHDGAFVWADNNPANYESTAPGEFSVRASGGVRIHTNAGLTSGVTMAAGASSWSAVSDSSLKANIREVNGPDVLERIAQLPISRWNYVAQRESVEHVGPMAQDFYRLFGLGEDDRHIDMLDPAGIALAAIKELYSQNRALQTQNQELRLRIEALESKIP